MENFERPLNFGRGTVREKSTRESAIAAAAA
jgi:hypothetical protein